MCPAVRLFSRVNELTRRVERLLRDLPELGFQGAPEGPQEDQNNTFPRVVWLGFELAGI